MRDIPGFEGLYACTSCGKIWSHRQHRFLRPGGVPDNYYIIFLTDAKGVRKCYYVHRLVALTYVPNPNNLPIVNHKDEHKDHNWASNLEWCTAKYNINYSDAPRKRSKPVYCVELDKTFESGSQAARELHLHQCNVSSVLRGKLPSTGGYHFRFA